ncbi:MAG TPA: hypothetical protein VHF47_08635 [Acidimicrobiales bacterium]|nr:hypothetical protein [Acidimicrobiales bacterium]
MRRTRIRARLYALAATTLVPATIVGSSLFAHGSSRAIATDTTLPTVPECVGVTINVTQPPITAFVCP